MEQKEEQKETLQYWWCPLRDAVCIKENCAFWDSKSNRCVIQTINKALEHLYGILADIDIDINTLIELT
jgi:hypothetical protein